MSGSLRCFRTIASLFVVVSVAQAFASEKPKVFVTGENSFQVSGKGGQESVSGIANATAAEGIKLFRDECPAADLTTRSDKADYIVGVTDDGSGAGRKGRRAVVSTQEGTMLFANSTRSLKNAVKDACGAIEKDWSTKKGGVAPAASPSTAGTNAAAPAVRNAPATDAGPAGAPIIVTTFGTGSVPMKGSVSLTFSIINPNPGKTLSGISFANSLPAGLSVGTPNGLVGSCGGGTVTAAVNSSFVTLAGATLAGNGSCAFSVNVTASSAGLKSNTTSAISSSEAGMGNTSNTATLTVMQ